MILSPMGKMVRTPRSLLPLIAGLCSGGLAQPSIFERVGLLRGRASLALLQSSFLKISIHISIPYDSIYTVTANVPIMRNQSLNHSVSAMDREGDWFTYSNQRSRSTLASRTNSAISGLSSVPLVSRVSLTFAAKRCKDICCVQVGNMGYWNYHV